MYRLIEAGKEILFWVSSFLLTLLAIRLSEIFNSDWLLLLIPCFIALLLFISPFVEESIHRGILFIHHRLSLKEEKRK